MITRKHSGLGPQPQKWLAKKARHGNRGFPVGTVAFYGPTDQRASKVAVAILLAADSEPAELRRWFSDEGDVRYDPEILEEVVAFLQGSGIRSVAMVDGIIGCPHEEGVDYEGSTCPQCPFWAGRDRWTDARLL